MFVKFLSNSNVGRRMEERGFPRCVRPTLLFWLLASLAAATGCTSALATAMWLVHGPNVDPEFDVFREKKVAVVCRTLDFQYQFPTVPKDLARGVSLLLRQNVRKIEVVDARKVEEWMDNNSWEEYTEVGKALDADLVLGIDLEGFSIYEGQTLYQGKANLSVKVYDCHTGELLVEKRLPRSVFPPNSPVPTDEMQEVEFRRKFVGELAGQLGRHFYPHDPHAYFAAEGR